MNGLKLLMTVALTVVAGASHANADVYDHFNHGLAGLPSAVFEGREPGGFVNFHAIAMTAPAQKIGPTMVARGSLAAQLPIFQVAFSAPAENFAALTGIEPYELNFLAFYGQNPSQAVAWGMNPTIQAKLVRHLTQVGFSPDKAATHTFRNGELGVVQLDAADPNNPWRWAAGAASLVKNTPSLFYQSQSEAGLQAVLQQPSALQAEAGATLSEYYGAAADLVTQALFFSFAFGALAGGIDVDGLPPYLGGMLADLHGIGGEKTLLTLVYSDCTQAAKATAVLQAHWPLDPALSTDFASVPTSLDCLATATVKNTPSNPQRNPSFDALYASMQGQSFVPVAVQ